MKILIIHCEYQYRGGEDTVVEEEMKLLQQAGHEVELLLFSNIGHSFFKILQLPFNISSYYETKRRIRGLQPDVVHIHNLHFAASPSVIYAVKHSNVPFVCTLHNYRLLCPSATLFYKGSPFLYSLSGQFPWKAIRSGVYKNSKLLTFWMALAMRGHRWLGTWRLPNRFIVLSAHAKKIFDQSKLKLHSEQLVIKPNFASITASPICNERNGFLFVGRLSEEKGIPFLLRLFANSNHQITIAGDGPLKDEVNEYAKNHDNIIYAGSLTKSGINELMQSSAALIFPSIWYEGMPLTIIEAFANSLPVIATKLGAMEYMVTPHHDGLLFEAGNEKALSTTIDYWQALPTAEKKNYETNARNTYESFYSSEKNAEQLLAIYHSIERSKENVPGRFVRNKVLTKQSV